MTAFFWNIVFLGTVVITTTSCHAQSDVEVIEGYEYVKAIYDDVHRHRERPFLLKSSSQEKCYPEIGCFAPATGIVTGHNLYPDPPETIATKFRLYTRNNREAEQVMDYIDKSTIQTSLFNPQVPIIFIIHGMNENGGVEWIINMKNSLLDEKNVNIITVDWGKGAPLPYYGQGIVNSELVSRQIARILILLKELRGYNISQTHMIGYSLGAHLAGFTAKFLKGKESIARITGLDPAGPNFEEKDETLHLSYLDADYVDIVHTSAGSSILTGNVGILKAIGHVDFYPNGGTEQPGCGFFQFVCNHRRAYLLFIESIKSDCEFSSISCKSYAEFKQGKCSDGTEAILGYHSHFGAPRGSYYLFTNDKSPYCIKKSL